MRTLEYLTDPSLRELYWPGVTASLLIALMTGPLSVLVVLRRLAFVGHGVSHAAFGGVGLGLLIGVGLGIPLSGGGGLWLDAFVLAFALATAWLIARLTRRGMAEFDTAIGVVLATCMALGFVLHGIAGERAAAQGRAGVPGLETVLFGGVLHIGWPTAALAAGSTALTLAAMVALHRPLIFWAFDEAVAVVHGVRTEAMRSVALVLLAVVVIAVVKLAGVVLATAMLVMPGAIALNVMRRFGGRSLGLAVAYSTSAAMLGAIGGLLVSFESPAVGLDLPVGPSVVGVLAVGYGLSRFAAPVRG